jgi:hypothetical protein
MIFRSYWISEEALTEREVSEGFQIKETGKRKTYRPSGASFQNPLEPIISLGHTSRVNQQIWPTTHPRRSPSAAVQLPLRRELMATRANGRYGAVIVIRPKREI